MRKFKILFYKLHNTIHVQLHNCCLMHSFFMLILSYSARISAGWQHQKVEDTYCKGYAVRYSLDGQGRLLYTLEFIICTRLL
jgi:hypothetical protein